MTREQWKEIWKSIKVIEESTKFLKPGQVKWTILYEVKKMKEQIQSIIGQME
jgi:hypothetical protein